MHSPSTLFASPACRSAHHTHVACCNGKRCNHASLRYKAQLASGSLQRLSPCMHHYSSLTCQASDEDSPGVVQPVESLPPVPSNQANRWPKFIGALFLSGITLGPLLDSFHSRVHLLEYDKAAFSLLGVDFSVYEVGVLGLLYISIGVAQVLLDGWEKDWCDPATTELYTYRLDIRNVILSTVILAGYLYTSAQLYAQNMPYFQESLTLAPLALGVWRVFDNTRAGAIVGLAMLVGAPVIEFGIIQELGWWHYPRADLLGSGGLPSWVPWCYCAYTPATANLARWFWKEFSKPATSQQ